MSLPPRSIRTQTNILGAPRPISISQYIDTPKSRNFQLMFKEINFTLYEAISKVEDIYNRFDVRFPIRHQLETVMRILTPIELKGAIDSRQVYFLLGHKDEGFGKFQMKRDQQVNVGMNFRHKSDFTKQKIFHSLHKNSQDNSSDEYFKESNIKNHLNDAINDRINVHDKFSIEGIMGDNQSRKKKGVRSRGLEDHLCQWIMECYDSGRQVCKSDVIHKARKIGQDYNLKASVGWYNNFINRNLQIKQILVSSNYKRRTLDPSNSPAPKQYWNHNDFGRMDKHEDKKNVKSMYFEQQQQSDEDDEDLIYDDEKNQTENQNTKLMSTKNDERQEQSSSHDQSEDDKQNSHAPLMQHEKIKQQT